MDDEALSKAYAKVHPGGEGGLKKREVGLMIVHLRAAAVDVSPDEDWIQPTAAEIASAMRSMDHDGDDAVSLEGFKQWYVAKGGQEYAEDPSVWGDDDERAPRADSLSDTSDEEQPQPEPEPQREREREPEPEPEVEAEPQAPAVAPLEKAEPASNDGRDGGAGNTDEGRGKGG